jgi:hypothetical protein
MFIQISPNTAIEWTQVVFVGLIEGLAASGVYEVGVKVAESAIKDVGVRGKQLVNQPPFDEDGDHIPFDKQAVG